MSQSSIADEGKSPKIIPVVTQQPEEGKVYPMAVIGAGAGGTMAAKRAVLNNTEVLLFAGAKQERRRSRGNWVRTVDNIPGLSKYKRTLLELRNEVLEELVKSPLSHNLYLIEESIFSVEKHADYFMLVDGLGKTYFVKYLVLATGFMDEQPHIQGSIRHILPFANAQTVAYCPVCDGHRSLGKKTVVIGYQESAAYTALLLAEKYQHPSMVILTNGHPHEFNPELMKRLEQANISLVEEPILSVRGENGILEGFQCENGKAIQAEMAFVALGIRPNNQLALKLGAQVDARGLVICDANGESSVANLFVIGDLRANSMKQIYTAWQHAVESVQLINKRLREANRPSI
jgi:thioredoxin reductase (NADPH)